MRIISLFFALIFALGVKAQFFSYSSGSAIDSGEVIGNFLYLYQLSDTVIVDLSTIAVESDSLWTISSGKYEQIYDLPFNQEFQGYSIVNDSIFLGQTLPFVGIKSDSIGDALGFIGFTETSNDFIVNGWIDLVNGATNWIKIDDTTSISVVGNEYIDITADEVNVYGGLLNFGGGGNEVVDTNDYEYVFINSSGCSMADYEPNKSGGVIINSANCELNNAEAGSIIGGYDVIASGSHITVLGVFGANGDGNTGVIKGYNAVYMGQNVPVLLDSAQTGIPEGYALVIANGVDTLNPSTSLVVQHNGQVGISVEDHNPDYQLEIGGTDAVKLPIGDISERPTPTEGLIRANSETNNLDYYNGAEWHSVIKYTGWSKYINSTYTASNKLLVAAGDTVTLHFDSLNIADYMPFGVDSMYGIGDSVILTDGIGNSYLFTLDFKASNDNSNGYGGVIIDIGGSVGIILDRLYTFPRGLNQAHSFSTTNFFYTLDTFLANGGKIKYYSETGDSSLWDLELRLQKL